MLDMIAVGAGEVFEKYWFPAIQKSKKARLVGIIEPQGLRLMSLVKMVPQPEKIFGVTSLERIPSGTSKSIIILVLTPDHFPVIRELAEKGFRNIVVEKPLVSRDHELPLILELASQHNLKLYSVDMYLPKAFHLAALLHAVSDNDPRLAFLYCGGQSLQDASAYFGSIEGASASVIEGGDFGIPSLDRRPWLEKDPEVGGMLRDLGTHAFAPLANAGILDLNAEVLSATLAKFTHDRSGIEPITNRNDVEMYVSAQLACRDIPIHVAFGKLPQKGGEWSLAVRGSKGMFFTSLRSGQPGVVLCDDDMTIPLRLSVSPMEFVLEEICMFYNGLLPGFDGNLGVIHTALEMNARIRDKLFPHPHNNL